MDESLDFGSVEVSASAEIFSPELTLFLLVVFLVTFIGLWIGSALVAYKLFNGQSNLEPPTINSFSPALRLLVLLACVAFLIVQALAVTDVYFQTTVVNDSVDSYFQYISATRLLGMSHAHIFGFTLMYGFYGLMTCCCSISEMSKCFLVSALIWSPIFDVAGWWGIKYLGTEFEWVSNIAGAELFILQAIVTFLVVKEAFAWPKAPS